MESYDIKELEALSNIKAHTIRIWEKRYGLFHPTRTDTNIRRYDALQLKKLLNVVLLLGKGFKISKISTLDAQQINELILKDTSSNESNNESKIINDLVVSTLEFDTIKFEKILNSVLLRYGVLDGILQVIYPFLVKTGILWSTENIMPAQEHLVVNIIRMKLITAMDGIATNSTNTETYTLFLPPNEFHEIGLLLAQYILLKHGYICYYLGQNVPYQNIQSTIKKFPKTNLITFIHDRNINEEWKEFIDKIKSKKLLVVCNEKTKPLNSINKNHQIIHHPQNFIDKIK